MGCVLNIVRILILALAVIALCRLWSHQLLWWSILAAVLFEQLTVWSARQAYRAALASSGWSKMPDPGDHESRLLYRYHADREAKESPIVNFWVKASMVGTALEFVLVVVGLIVSFS
jgi:hypothetical protein